MTRLTQSLIIAASLLTMGGSLTRSPLVIVIRVPTDFIGPVIVAYGVPGAPELPRSSDGALVLDVPASGVVKFSSYRRYGDHVTLHVRRSGLSLAISDMFTDPAGVEGVAAVGRRQTEQVLPLPDGTTVRIWIDGFLIQHPGDPIDDATTVSTHIDKVLGEIAADLRLSP
jgi:hypothetical protein